MPGDLAKKFAKSYHAYRTIIEHAESKVEFPNDTRRENTTLNKLISLHQRRLGEGERRIIATERLEYEILTRKGTPYEMNESEIDKKLKGQNVNRPIRAQIHYYAGDIKWRKEPLTFRNGNDDQLCQFRILLYVPVVNSEIRHFYIHRKIILDVLKNDQMFTKHFFEKFGDDGTFEMDQTFLQSLREAMIFHQQQVFINEKDDQLDRRSLWSSFDDLLRYALKIDSSNEEPLSDPFRM